MMTYNRTPLSFLTFPSVDLEDEPFQVVIAKGVFDIVHGSPLMLAKGQEPISNEETVPFKLGTDIICHATAYAPFGEKAASWQVCLSVGTLRKRLTVTGPRAWVHTPLLGWSLSPIVSVRQVPIDYSLAFGGPGYDENPLGLGFVDLRRVDTTQEIRAPQILSGDARPHALGERLRVEGFGPIATTWRPRRDASHFERFSAAHPDLVTSGYLRGDEEVTLEQMHASIPRLAFRLPNWLLATALMDRAGFRYGAPLLLDSVEIDVARMRAVLLWRAAPPIYKDGVARVDLAVSRRSS